MINFFRRIRQKLLTEGRLSKYLIYAIGQIALVMIGILLALQVNNWNESRKNRISERQVLHSILQNLERDQNTLNEASSRFRRTIQNIFRLYDHDPIPDDSLGIIVTRSTGVKGFIPLTSAFDRSISNGKFDLILNDQLAERIQRLYQFDYLMADSPSIIIKDYHTRYRDLSDSYDAVELASFDRDQDFYGYSMIPWDIDALKKLIKDPEMKRIHKQMNINASIILGAYSSMMNKNSSLQKSIREYLQSE